MNYKPFSQPHPYPASIITPRVIIHGGSGNITRLNLSPEKWALYHASLLDILRSTHHILYSHNADALEACVHAVSLFEQDPLFNCGKGAVFTREGRVELEASVMVSHGSQKRGVAVSMVRHVKSPIKLAKELLLRGNEEGGGGGQGHIHLSGDKIEALAKEWGCEMVEESYFWTRPRWEEHKRGLEREMRGEKHTDIHLDSMDTSLQPNGEPWPLGDPTWDGSSYLPQGTVGCVVLDRYGTLAVATSTGGLTNKLPGRIGDTPTIGAGFWAEEWDVPAPSLQLGSSFRDILNFPLGIVVERTRSIISECLGYTPSYRRLTSDTLKTHKHAVAMSGTGNGDSFLKLNAVRTVAALLRFSTPKTPSLASAITWMAGPNGELQRSAEDRWGRTGEGLAGIIGIEFVGGVGKIAADFNMGMFRAWVDEKGEERVMVFHEEY